MPQYSAEPELVFVLDSFAAISWYLLFHFTVTNRLSGVLINGEVIKVV